MNLLLFEPDEIGEDNTVRLHDRRGLHIARVLSCKPGDVIRAGVLNGPVGNGEILTILDDGRNVVVVLRFSAEGGLSEPPAVDLVMGLVRPIMLKRILSQVTSLGVGRIFLINSRRVEKSFFQATLLKDENYRSYLVDGLEQAKDTRMPDISVHERFKPFIEDFIPAIAAQYARMLVAHPDSAMDLKRALGGKNQGRILLAVGPEGGWIDYEVERFLAHSFVPVNLGRRVLRTDTAVVALLAQLLVLQGN